MKTVQLRRRMILMGVTGVVVQFIVFLLSEVDGTNHHRHQHHLKSEGESQGDQYLMRPRPAKGFLSVTKLQVYK